MGGFADVLRQTLAAVSGVVAPRLCVVCGRALSAGEDFLCLDCLWAMPRVHAHHGIQSWLADPLARIQPSPRLAAWFYYRSDRPYHKIIHDLKFRDRPNLGTMAGAAFAREIAGDGFFDGIDLIVPVPVPPHKLLLRGYNQAERIARGVSSVTGIPVSRILGEKSVRRTQVGLTAAQRAANISAKRFTVSAPASLRGRHILIVDDVITTGATVISAAQALKTASPAIGRISFLSLALTAPV